MDRIGYPSKIIHFHNILNIKRGQIQRRALCRCTTGFFAYFAYFHHIFTSKLTEKLLCNRFLKASFSLQILTDMRLYLKYWFIDEFKLNLNFKKKPLFWFLRVLYNAATLWAGRRCYLCGKSPIKIAYPVSTPYHTPYLSLLKVPLVVLIKLKWFAIDRPFSA